MGFFGSSLGDVHTAHAQGRTTNRGIPRSDSDDETPDFWGEETGDCVSASGRVRKQHWFVSEVMNMPDGFDARCVFCDSIRGPAGLVAHVRKPIIVRAPRPIRPEPRRKAPVEVDVQALAEAHEALHAKDDGQAAPTPPKRRTAPLEPEEPVWECANCGGVNPEALSGMTGEGLKWCLACGHMRDRTPWTHMAPRGPRRVTGVTSAASEATPDPSDE